MMQSKFNILVLTILVMSSIVAVSPTYVCAGEIRGSEVFGFWSNSTILDMNYNLTAKVFTAVVTGPNGTIGVFWLLFNASVPPKAIGFDSVVIRTLQN